jgi:hypothetical protein
MAAGMQITAFAFVMADATPAVRLVAPVALP